MSSKVVNGVVTEIKQYTKPGANWVLYSAIVNGDSYGFKFEEPTFQEGAHIEFTASQNPKGYYDADLSTVKILAEQAPMPAASSGPTASPADTRQKSIVLQSSYERGILMVDSMIAREIVKLPAQAKRLEFYEQLLETTVRRLYTEALDPIGQFELPPEQPPEFDPSMMTSGTDEYKAV